jgi:transposase
MASDRVAVRRRYSEALKAEVMAECDVPGASVAKVAMARGINANVVHRWRQLAREGGQATVAKPAEFVAVALAPQVPAHGRADRDIEIELRRGPVTMKLTWPVSAAADLAAWTRELLR